MSGARRLAMYQSTRGSREAAQWLGPDGGRGLTTPLLQHCGPLLTPATELPLGGPAHHQANTSLHTPQLIHGPL